MDGRSDTDEVDEAMLPGFRFHPTDEELVGFYLKRKVQQKPLSIELIRQLDIYKYDPWELPKLAAAGEKELYFYCPRDRKYRNSARPNRVTGGGFWKATGTDRPVYSSEGSKCIGLKKSLVFYKGRAARGIKTEWMMHELRLPSLTDPSLPKKPFDIKIPANDSWAICKIYKKTNSMAQRALSQSWASPLPEASNSDTKFGSEKSPEAGSMIQFGCGNGAQLRATDFGHPPLEVASYKPINLANSKTCLHPVSNVEIPCSSMFTPVAMPVLGDAAKSSASVDYEQMHRYDGIINGNWGSAEEENLMGKSDQWGAFKAVRFPFKLPSNLSDGWGPNLFWDSSSHPSEMARS